ncbi:hypothetical protein N9L19_00250 [bacterium]|nr:hypothetical protein [bacterium]
MARHRGGRGCLIANRQTEEVPMMGQNLSQLKGETLDINAEETWAVKRAWAPLLAMACAARETLKAIRRTHDRFTQEEAHQIQGMHIRNARRGDTQTEGQQVTDDTQEQQHIRNRTHHKRRNHIPHEF